jgi:hypothetical protein
MFKLQPKTVYLRVSYNSAPRATASPPVAVAQIPEKDFEVRYQVVGMTNSAPTRIVSDLRLFTRRKL